MDRRSFLATISAVGVAGVAGCQGTDGQTERIAELEAKLDAQNETIAELESELADRENRIDQIRTDRNELQTTVLTKEDEIADLEAELADKRDELSSLEAELSDSRDHVDSLEGEITRLESEIEELEGQLAELDPEQHLSDEELETALSLGTELREAVGRVASSTNAATGWHIGDGDWVTVDHVFGATADSSESPAIETFSKEVLSGSRGEGDRELDLRVVESDPVDAKVDHTDFEAPAPGDAVFSIGHPTNVGRWIIAAGRFEKADELRGETRYLLDIPTHSGNSGSPVFTLDGEFVGITTHATTDGDEYDQPDRLFTDFNGYNPFALVLPGETVAEKLDDWGY